MTGCLSGCAIRGEHSSTPPVGHVPCDSRCGRRCELPEHCSGCLPRQADVGRLCQSCYAGLRAAVTAIPGLVAWLQFLTVPGARGDGSGPVSGSREAPVPLDMAAVDAAQGLHALLVKWCETVREHHPDHPRLPDLRGTLRASGRMVWSCELPGHRAGCLCVDGGWYRSGGGVVGVRSAPLRRDPGWSVRVSRRLLPDPDAAVVVGPRRLRRVDIRFAADRLNARGEWRDDTTVPDPPAATVAAARWLLRWADWVAGQDWAGVMRGELAEAVRGAESRWPRGDRVSPRHLCPDCDRLAVAVHPPSYPGAERLIHCEGEGCGAMFTEARWEQLSEQRVAAS